jgi:hypothetical protein
MVVGFARESDADTQTKHYCQRSPSLVSFLHVGLPPVERSNVQLPFLLYVCLFWRGEAKRLGIQS